MCQISCKIYKSWTALDPQSCWEAHDLSTDFLDPLLHTVANYRATQCVSAVGRCPYICMYVCRPLCMYVCMYVCMSVCLSHSRIVSKRLKIRQNSFTPGSLSIILVSWGRTVLPNSRENSSSGALNTCGGKNCDFRLKLQFVSETVQDRSMVATER